MTTVHFKTGDSEEWETVWIKTSGWVVCVNEDRTKKMAFPPHAVVAVEDERDRDEGESWGLKAQNPHGRI